MRQSDVGATLHEWLLLAHVPVDECAQRELQECVWNYVDDRKCAGWPVERVIIAMKQIARDAGLKPSSFIARPEAQITSRDELLVEMVGWCIRRYYGAR